MGVIYKITNKENGKIYIGKRMWDSKKFLASSYYGSGLYIKRTIAKIGTECFHREILEEIDDGTMLSTRERYWISHYKSNSKEHGYNLSEGGENLPGFHHSEETKQKIGNANAISLIGNVISEEARKKRSNALKGRVINDEHRTKISNALTGKPKSELHNLHNSLSKIGILHTSEHNDKIGRASKEWHDRVGFSDESINKMKIHATERFANENERYKMSLRLKGHVVSEETRRKISETLKKKKMLTSFPTSSMMPQ